MIDLTDDIWWRTAVIYQIYPRSFADSNGDGIGDLPGITGRLDHVASLGADAIWLSPFYPSPQCDGGYDVADYRNVDPQFGTLEDFDALVARAHDLALRVIVDLVPNHASSEHVAFHAALASGPGSAERGLFHFRDGLGDHGEFPPNDWQSMFEGSAWTQVTEPDGTPGQWYLHLFDKTQPDWNWEEPRVRADFETTLRFWLDRGVDGFRVDVCDALIKAPGLPNWPHPTHGVVQLIDGRTPPMWDQEGIHEIFRDWRAIVNSYSGSRILCAEAWLPPERTARIVRPDEMHQAFNFAYLEQLWDADAITQTIKASLAVNDAVDAPTTWVLSNHDVMRHASRFGYNGPVALEHGVGADDPQPDRTLGLRRARAATLLMLALPGSAYLYQGEELGLPEVTDLPDDARQDPVWERSQHQIRGRDGCRVPLPWDDSSSSNGFSTVAAADTWLPVPSYYASFSAADQTQRPNSTLNLYISALAARRSADLKSAPLMWDEARHPGVVSFSRGDNRVIGNVSGEPVSLPPEAQIIVTSDPEVAVTRIIPRDTTVWLTTS